jgi:hypothetical protein
MRDTVFTPRVQTTGRSAAGRLDRLIAAVLTAVPPARRVSDRLGVRIAACALLFGGLAALLWWALGLIARL